MRPWSLPSRRSSTALSLAKTESYAPCTKGMMSTIAPSVRSCRTRARCCLTALAVEPARAVRQHRALVRQLRTLGAIVDIIPFVHGAYDSVFAKDSAVLLRRDGRDHGLMAQPLHP